MRSGDEEQKVPEIGEAVKYRHPLEVTGCILPLLIRLTQTPFGLKKIRVAFRRQIGAAGRKDSVNLVEFKEIIQELLEEEILLAQVERFREDLGWHHTDKLTEYEFITVIRDCSRLYYEGLRYPSHMGKDCSPYLGQFYFKGITKTNCNRYKDIELLKAQNAALTPMETKTFNKDLSNNRFAPHIIRY